MIDKNDELVMINDNELMIKFVQIVFYDYDEIMIVTD